MSGNGSNGNGRWAKGCSGNPRGRPPGELTEAKKMVLKHLPKGVLKMIELTECGDLKIEFQAEKYLLDHGMGKAPQHIQLDTHLSDENDVPLAEAEKVLEGALANVRLLKLQEQAQQGKAN